MPVHVAQDALRPPPHALALDRAGGGMHVQEAEATVVELNHHPRREGARRRLYDGQDGLCFRMRGHRGRDALPVRFALNA